MGQIRVLIVDDSSFARDVIKAILSTDSEIQVVGEAVHGKEAVEKVRELRPDIVTMDIEMPVMNGLDAIEVIMASHAVPILVVTTRGDAHTAYAAISKGALDLVVKPEVNLEGAREFIDKLKVAPNRIPARHPAKNLVVARLDGEVQLLADRRTFGHGIDDVGGEVVRMRCQEAKPLEPGHVRHGSK